MKNDFKMDDPVKKILDSYTVSSSLDKEKEATLTILKGYLPLQNKSTPLRTIKQLLAIALRELLATSKLHYGIMIALLLVLFPIVEVTIDPYLILFFTAPIPLFIGFWNIFGRGHQVMMDLEKTFKYSYQQVVASKIATITGVSIIFLSLPITYFFFAGFHLETLSIFKFVIWGLTPIFLFAVYLLVITTMNRHDHLLSVSVLIWCALGFFAISTPIGNMMLNVHLVVYLLLNSLSILLLIYKMSRLLQNKERSFVIL